MNAKLILISVLFLLSAVIALLNTEETTLNFMFFSINAPLIVMIVVIFILGLVTGIGISSAVERKKKLAGESEGKQAKELESKNN